MKLMNVLPHLGCKINLPAALRGDTLHSLPPYEETDAYPVDAYPACPENWMRAEAPHGAFFVGIKKGQGLWLDFNSCLKHAHDVAVVISIQGVNPITGKPQGEPILEQYKEGNIPQNYLATTGTPQGMFWLDGFRGADGEVRQYLFSEETMRGIAAQIVGENRTYSIGLAFFISKDPKPYVPSSPYRAKWITASASKPTGPDFWDRAKKLSEARGKGRLGTLLRSATDPAEITYGYKVPERSFLPADDSRMLHAEELQMASLLPEHRDGDLCAEMDALLEEETKLEIAAGARINQQIHKDPKELSYWKEAPESILYINYAQQTLVRQILGKGQVGSSLEGGLKGLKVGN